MMSYFKTTLIAIAVTIITFFGVYNYLPQDTLTLTAKNVGATITTILGSDTLSASRSVINTNFSNLNTQLLTIVGTTSITTLTTASSLATVGTITSGTWNGTVITVPYGGTGWANVQANAVLYGNGTGKLSTTTAGINGQFLSLVAGVPTWADSSVDQTANFNWTGTHRFKTLIASTTLTFSQSGAGYTWILPTNAMTASTVPKFLNTSGNIVYEREDWAIIASTTLTSAVSSTTLSFNYTGSSLIKIFIDMPVITGQSSMVVQFNGDTGNNYAWKVANLNSASLTFSTAVNTNVLVLVTPGATNVGWGAEVTINNVPSRTKEYRVISLERTDSAATAPSIFEGSGVWANTSSRITSITLGSINQLQIGTRITVMGTRN